MRKFYTLTGQAKKDLGEINDFIAEDNPQAANRFLDTFERKCQMLAQFPEMGRCWDDIISPLRSFPLGKYLIFYRLSEEGAEIIRVLSGYRDFEAIFPELDDSE
jgi:toxin ParE1/3/4